MMGPNRFVRVYLSGVQCCDWSCALAALDAPSMFSTRVSLRATRGFSLLRALPCAYYRLALRRTPLSD